ncbi:MAG: TolC family protein [Gammaproteobacteria bacterium]|jgi:outer membrane protein TolC
MFHYRNCVLPAGKARTLALLLLPGLALLPASAGAALELGEAIRIALENDPASAASRASARAQSENAIAEGQLPDPRLRTGLYNLPLDDLDINSEPTTQFRLGIEQTFPRGDTLYHRQLRTESLAGAEQANAASTTLQTVRDVRRHFLELYYQVRAAAIVAETRKLFAQLVDITQAHYGSGRVSQQDVLRASLELARLDDRATRIETAADENRAALAKWLAAAADLPLAEHFPELPALPARTQLDTALLQHPVLAAETARVNAMKQGIRIAQEQYKPGWSAGIEYRKRFGDDPDGNPRSDMMAAMLNVDLPLFTGNRQDRRLAASIAETEAAELRRDDKLRELRRMLAADYADWQRLGERAALYEAKLLREATANADASLHAYQSGVTEFTTLMRARITELDVRLDELRIRVDRARAQANLLYLAGEGQ